MDRPQRTHRRGRVLLSTIKIRYVRHIVQAQVFILLLYALASAEVPIKFLWGLDPLLSFSAVLSGVVFPASLLLLGVAMLLLSAAVGRVFCGWICPLGFIQDLVPTLTRSKRISPDLRLLKYLLLAAGIILPVIAGWSFLEWITPLSIAPRGLGWILDRRVFAAATFLALVLVILFSLLQKRAWCRYVCPLGAILSLPSAYRPLRIRIDTERCIECLRCEKACSMGVIDVKGRHGLNWSSECILCLACRDVCPKDAIGLKLEG